MIATSICTAVLILWNIFAPEAQILSKVETMYIGVFTISIVTDVWLTIKKLSE